MENIMFDIPKTATRLYLFAEEHSEALQNAALMLGGHRWLLRVQDLLEDLHSGAPLIRCTQREAAALLGLFGLRKHQETASSLIDDREVPDPIALHAHEIAMLGTALTQALMCVDENESSAFGPIDDGGQDDRAIQDV